MHAYIHTYMMMIPSKAMDMGMNWNRTCGGRVRGEALAGHKNVLQSVGNLG